MRLANRVLLCALGIFIFSALTFAQTPRPENDPRNQSPLVGTGGPERGATGLFTIYNGSTLKKEKFTFSEMSLGRYCYDLGRAEIDGSKLGSSLGDFSNYNQKAEVLLPPGYDEGGVRWNPEQS